MRTIKELLTVMLMHERYFIWGLCSWANHLYFFEKISRQELDLLENYIRKHRPFVLSSKEVWKYRKNPYYWERGHLEPRIKWIHKHIRKS